MLLTMNIDLMMERALLEAGIGFTRVVQHKSERELHVTHFHDESFTTARPDRLFDLIEDAEARPLSPEAVAGSELKEPILFKLRGSQDINGSCALTRPQLLAQARMVISYRLIPSELEKIALNTPIVFLGVGLLDPEFQYTNGTMLFNAWATDYLKYLVQLSPEHDREYGYRRVEDGLWAKIKDLAKGRNNLATIEEASDRFVDRLIAAL